MNKHDFPATGLAHAALESPPPLKRRTEETGKREANTDETAANGQVPKKFRDPKTGAVNVDALLRSYRELERRLGAEATAAAGSGTVPDRAAALRALGWPETPEAYRIDILEDFLGRDYEMERLLHEAGFTEEQVQLVYDLAADRLAPLMIEVANAARGAGDAARLEAHFGGKDRWKEIRRQIRKWGEKTLPPDAFRALSASYDGVIAMHRMMQGGEEPGLAHGGTGGEALTETQLKKLMNDPRYWRDHDPALTRKVDEGFKRLYPNGG
jgi:hypothetical protein